MPTIRDVATYAQVSPATVSQVLNGQGQFHEATRQRINDALRILNYRHRPRGRPKADAQSRQIVLLLHRSSSDHQTNLTLFWEKVISGIRFKLAETGDYLTLFLDETRKLNGQPFEQLVEQGRVDGVIFGNVHENAHYVSWLTERQVPFIAMDHIPKHQEFSFIHVNGVAGGRRAAEHLASLGHRRLAFVKPRNAHCKSYVQQRLAGFKQGVAKYGGTLVAEKSFPATSHATVSAMGERLARDLVASEVTGVFCPNDALAAACVNVFEAVGVKVPEAVSVVGFDDIGLQSRSGLRLTSITYDKQRLGRAAAGLLLQAISAQDHVDAVSMSLKVELVHRQTTTDVMTESTHGHETQSAHRGTSTK